MSVRCGHGAPYGTCAECDTDGPAVVPPMPNWFGPALARAQEQDAKDREQHPCYGEKQPQNTKPTNPKDAVGIKKVPFSCLPLRVLAGPALAMMEGALKYGRHNYRAVGVRASVYFDAFMRHTSDWWEGTDIDPDSGVHHLDKAIACLMVIRDSMLRGNWTDDRPPRVAEEWVAEANKQAAALLEKYPEPKPAYTQENL